MLTISYYSPISGQTETFNIGCDGTTDHGGSYRLRKEFVRSNIKQYVSHSSLTSKCYKVETTTYYDCNTKFMSDADASTFATHLMSGVNFTITCTEDSYTNEPALLITTSAPVKTNAKDGVVTYDFTMQISTVQTNYPL